MGDKRRGRSTQGTQTKRGAGLGGTSTHAADLLLSALPGPACMLISNPLALITSMGEGWEKPATFQNAIGCYCLSRVCLLSVELIDQQQFLPSSCTTASCCVPKPDYSNMMHS